MIKKQIRLKMNKQFNDTLVTAIGSKEFMVAETIQNLWSGYGEINRVNVTNGICKSVVLKHVRLPQRKVHPRGWNTDISHNRKIKSYEVESEFYKNYADKLTAAKIPNCLAIDFFEDEVLLVLEDLDAAGYTVRLTSVNWEQILMCIDWLANFHATFLGETPIGLWKTGTYWHLETRPDELEVLTDLNLKDAAAKIDDRLKNAKYQTYVHGDAKLANFCFSENGAKVAGLDFQYVGGGCGMKDLAYFVGSCLYEEDCEQLETKILEAYFSSMERALKILNKQVDFQELESEWRALYPFAWTDFHRFLKGWSPGHWKINSYSERVTKEVLDSIKN